MPAPLSAARSRSRAPTAPPGPAPRPLHRILTPLPYLPRRPPPKPPCPTPCPPPQPSASPPSSRGWQTASLSRATSSVAPTRWSWSSGSACTKFPPASWRSPPRRSCRRAPSHRTRRPVPQDRRAAPPSPPALPRRPCWLLDLIPASAIGLSRLEHLLRNREMAALLAADPRLRHILRPLCRLRGRDVMFLMRMGPSQFWPQARAAYARP